MKLQKLLSYLRQCIQEYDLIHENDVIGVGVSGGKDSLTLLYGLRELEKFYPAAFTLKAFYVNSGFPGMDISGIRAFSEKMEIPFFEEKTEIAETVRMRQEKNPCSLCSTMRRGTLTAALKREGCNVLALGHQKEDYLSTLLLSALFKGEIYTFAPETYYEDHDLRIIRPMLYVPEGGVKRFAEDMALPVLENACPYDHKTKREEMQELLAELNRKYPGAGDRLLHAVEHSDIPDWKNLKG